jgi:hypothetical protein
MNNVYLPLAEQVAALLLSNGATTVAQLRAATGKSQPSISLAISSLAVRVCRLGAARSTRYALTQPILGLPASQLITLTTEQGQLLEYGDLTFLHGQQTYVRATQGTQWLTDKNKLPWFLEPLRPQGFLGRQLVRLAPNLPADPDAWNAEQVLYMAVQHAGDPPGAFNLGPVMGRFFSEAPSTHVDRSAYYDVMARGIGSSMPAASSAGGEQPKFVTEIAGDAANHQHLIVKFSPPRGTPFGERWHDLLHLEHLALKVLREHGVPAASTRIVESKERTYLESERFDRIGMEGKRHVVAATSIHDEFVKTPRQNWVATCESLVAQKLLSPPDLQKVARQYFFGQYIGNTDMHFVNLSFFVSDVAKPNFTVALAYDMLPMMWRPGVHSGELDASPIRPQHQIAGYAAEALAAREWAIDYWERATKLEALSSELAEASSTNVTRLKSNFAQS